MSGAFQVYGGPADAQFNPFPGLRPFDAEEDYLFFGREEQTDDLLRKLRTTRFLSILGRSGSGKSSLVRSGLIPSLWGGGMTNAGSHWRVVITRPGEDPIGNLAAALCEPGVLFDRDGHEELTRGFIEATLRASRRGLIDSIEQARLPEGNKILLLVDQFEEIFRYKRSRRVVGRDEAIAFVRLLLEVRESSIPCYIAITMRSDFIGDCMEFGTLPEIINKGIYLVPRMTRDELKSAIAGPVGVGGATITPRLVSRLLNDVGDDPDQLPLLQHALMRTWEQWRSEHEPGEGLDLRHYVAVGTLTNALSRHAEEAFGELDERGEMIAEKLFKALTDKASDARGVRRPAPLSEIAAVAGATIDEVIAVVEKFRAPGRSFLMPPAGVALHEASVIDISHESLMRIWDRLSTWADEEARAGQLYLSVARAAQRHEEGAVALWRDPELQFALTWRAEQKPTQEWANRYEPSFERAMRFLDASRDERDRDVQEREARRRRELRAARLLVAMLTLGSTIMLALGGYAFVQERRAEQETARAETALARAVSAQRSAEVQKTRAEEQRGRAQSEEQRAIAQQKVAEEQRARAAERTAFAENQRRLAEAERLKAESNESEAHAQKAAADTARQVAFAEKRAAEAERQKAVASETESRRLSRLDAARALALTVPQQKEPAQRNTAALLALEAYRLYRDNRGDVQDPALFTALQTALDWLRPAPVLRGEAASIRALAVVPGGRIAFAGSEDGRLVRYDLDEKTATTVATLGSAIRSVDAAPDGRHVAAATAGGELRLFDTGNAAASRDLAGGQVPYSAVAFAPKGSTLAAGKADGTVQLWNIDKTGAAPLPLAGAEGNRVTALAFSSTGRLGAGISRGGALIWNAADPSAAPRTVCRGLDVRSVAFSPDGNAIACGGARGQIVQEALVPGGTAISVTGHRSTVNSLSFDQRGETIASASSDGTIRLWRAGRADVQPIILTGHDSWVWAVRFSGERLVSGGEDRTVRLWSARSDALTAELCGVISHGRQKQLTREQWSRYMPADLAYAEGCPAQ